MDARQTLQWREEIMDFAECAREYCARHPDVECLHLAALNEAIVPATLVAGLRARQYAVHAAALTRLSQRMFLPEWRFALLDESALLDEVRRMRPWYRKKQS